MATDLWHTRDYMQMGAAPFYCHTIFLKYSNANAIVLK